MTAKQDPLGAPLFMMTSTCKLSKADTMSNDMCSFRNKRLQGPSISFRIDLGPKKLRMNYRFESSFEISARVQLQFMNM